MSSDTPDAASFESIDYGKLLAIQGDLMTIMGEDVQFSVKIASAELLIYGERL